MIKQQKTWWKPNTCMGYFTTIDTNTQFLQSKAWISTTIEITSANNSCFLATIQPNPGKLGFHSARC